MELTDLQLNRTIDFCDGNFEIIPYQRKHFLVKIRLFTVLLTASDLFRPQFFCQFIFHFIDKIMAKS